MRIAEIEKVVKEKNYRTQLYMQLEKIPILHTLIHILKIIIILRVLVFLPPSSSASSHFPIYDYNT